MKRIICFGLFLGAVSVFLLSACSKYMDNAAPMESGVMVVQASPDAPTLSLYLNEHTVDTALAFSENTGYTTVPAGNTQLKLVNMHRIVDTVDIDTTVDSVIVDSIITLVDQSLPVEANKVYSVFVYDSVSRIKTMTLADDLSIIATGNARIRFLHLSTGTPALDVYANETPLFTERTFADNATDMAKAAFDSVPPGNYTLNIKLSGKDSTVASLPSTALEAGAIYTLFAAGSMADTVRVRLITNYQPPK